MASSSHSSIIGVGILLLFVAAQVAEGDINVVLFGACKTVGGGSPYFSVMFCMDSLSPIVGNGTYASSYQDYAAISVDLLRANATSTEAKIKSLLKEGGGSRKEEDDVARGLRSCLALYSGIVARQADCKAAVKAGKFDEATASLERSASDATECEAGFGRTKAWRRP